MITEISQIECFANMTQAQALQMIRDCNAWCTKHGRTISLGDYLKARARRDHNFVNDQVRWGSIALQVYGLSVPGKTIEQISKGDVR